MRSETIPSRLQRAHDLIDEAISVIEDLREELLYKPGPWLDHAHWRASAAKRDIRKGLGMAQPVDTTTAAA